jgi:hypothetical protein
MRTHVSTRMFCLVLLASLVSSPAHSYTVGLSQSGAALRWAPGQKLYLAGNPAGSHELSDGFFRNAVVSALLQWKKSTNGAFDFDYWQGTDSADYPSGMNSDGLSTIFFASRANLRPDPIVIGYTQTTFNVDTGNLVETDTYLNDINFTFTENSQDTSSASAGGKSRVYAANVITHELGHAIGLSHSGSINASMLYVEFRDQSELGCDDVSGARALYGTPGTVAVRGRIVSSSGSGIAGIQVSAVSLERGIPLANAVTSSSGNYSIAGLEPGRYALVAEVFRGSDGTIPAQQTRTSRSSLCTITGDFEKQFVHKDGAWARIYDARSGNVSVPDYSISCSGNTPLAPGSSVIEGAAFVNVGSGASYSFPIANNAALRVTTLGYLLHLPMLASVDVIDSSGQSVATNRVYPLYSSNSLFEITDSAAEGGGSTASWVKLLGTGNSRSDYPGNSTAPQGSNQVVMVASASGNDINARCTMNVDPSTYQSPDGPPVRNYGDSTMRDQVGFCGTISQNSGDVPPDYGARIGWFLPWAVMMLWSKLRYNRRRCETSHSSAVS